MIRFRPKAPLWKFCNVCPPTSHVISPHRGQTYQTCPLSMTQFPRSGVLIRHIPACGHADSAPGVIGENQLHPARPTLARRPRHFDCAIVQSRRHRLEPRRRHRGPRCRRHEFVGRSKILADNRVPARRSPRRHDLDLFLRRGVRGQRRASCGRSPPEPPLPSTALRTPCQGALRTLLNRAASSGSRPVVWVKTNERNFRRQSRMTRKFPYVVAEQHALVGHRRRFCHFRRNCRNLTTLSVPSFPAA